MMNSTARRTLIPLVVLALLFSLMSSALANSEQGEPQVFAPAQQLSRVDLGGGSYARIENASLIPTENGNTISVTVQFLNGGKTDLDMIDYWLRIQSKQTGENYSVKIAPNDVGKKSVPANTSATVTYYSQTGGQVKLGDVIVQVIKWDFSQPNFERNLGQIHLGPETFTVPEGHRFNLNFSGMTLGTYVEKSIISKNEKYYNATVYYTVKNNGRSAITLPNLQYYILTEEGILYPLSTNSGTGTSLNPKMEKELILRGNIPVEISNSEWRFVVAVPVNDSKEIIPIATYSIPDSTQEAGADFAREYSFANANGLYHVQIDAMNRTPLEDKDIITASITIMNKGTSPLPVPKLGGKFVLDDVIDAEAQTVTPDKVLAISPGSNIKVYLYSLIPYTYEFSELRLVLQELVGNGEATEADTVLEILGKEVFTPIGKLAAGNEHRVNYIGNTSSYKVRDVRTYVGTSSKYVVVQLDVTNLEKRSAELMKFTGYIKTADDNVFPVQIAEIKSKMVPGGKALLEVAALIPETYDTEGATVIFGEAVQAESDGNNAPAGATAYINPIEIILPGEKPTETDLVGIDLYPYQLTIHKIKSQIVYGQDKIVLDFNYDLTKDPLVQANLEKKKIVIEVEDEKNNIALSKEYDFETGQNAGLFFELGSHEGKFEAVDEDLIFKIETMNNNYKFNVYEQFDTGYKKLLATKEIRWFATSD